MSERWNISSIDCGTIKDANGDLAVIVYGMGACSGCGTLGLAERTRLVAAAPNMLEALCALGVIGGGYCFCSADRDPDKTEHEPECRDARAAIAKATGEQP